MRRLALLMAFLSLTACGTQAERNAEQAELDARVMDVAYGIVLMSHGKPGEFRELVAEQSDYGDAAIYRAVTLLERAGRVRITRDGVFVVEPKVSK